MSDTESTATDNKDTSDLLTLQYIVDTADSSSNRMQSYLSPDPNISKRFHGISMSVWKQALRYAYARLVTVTDELNVLHTRIRDFSAQDDQDEYTPSPRSVASLEDEASRYDMPSPDNRWFEIACERQLRQRLGEIAARRAADEEVRDGYLKQLDDGLRATAAEQKARLAQLE